MSATVRELMAATDKSDVLSEAGPRVTRRLLLGSAVREPVRPGLDLNHDDQAIINQALAVGDAGGDVILMTHDNFAAMMAEEHGLKTFMLPPGWLKEPEQDDGAKEIARRDAEIARLKSAEPLPRLHFADEHGQPIERLEATLKRYRPLDRSEVEGLVGRVAAAAPMAKVEPGSASPPAADAGVASPMQFTVSEMMRSGFLGTLTPVTKADIDEYENRYATWLRSIRDKLAGLHVEWNRRREWPHAQLRAANDGSRPADNLLLELEASGSFLLSGRAEGADGQPEKGGKKGLDWLSLPLPPAVPRPRHPMEDVLRDFGGGGGYELPRPPVGPTVPNLRRNADAFYWRQGKREPSQAISLECASWRHGREEDVFRWLVWADDDEDIRGLVVGRVSATNLTMAVEGRLPLRIAFEDKETLPMAEQLVHEFERRVAAPPSRR